MNPAIYKIIHLAGISLLAIGVGGALAKGENQKTFAACRGIALLIMLVTGFGMLAKLKLGFPHFAMVKTVLWIVIAMLPVIFRKTKPPLILAILIPVALVGIMAWLGVMKPALW